MATKALTLRPKATDDLADIYLHTQERWGSQQADRYIERIDKAFDTIINNRFVGEDRSFVLPDLRAFNLGSHTIFYRSLPNTVLVIRILHHSMDYATHLSADH